MAGAAAGDYGDLLLLLLLVVVVIMGGGAAVDDLVDGVQGHGGVGQCYGVQGCVDEVGWVVDEVFG